VFVLDAGRLVEAGAPKNLLNDEGSAFRALYYASRGQCEGGENANIEKQTSNPTPGAPNAPELHDPRVA
jgi:hypothetical protein